MIYITKAGHTDAQRLDEPYLNQDCVKAHNFGLPLTKTTIPAGMYWVMGDNRCASHDSRAFGPIAKKTIVGRAFVRIWPLSRFKFL